MTLHIQARFIHWGYAYCVDVPLNEKQLKWNQFAIRVKETLPEKEIIFREKISFSCWKSPKISHGQIEVIVIEVLWNFKTVLNLVLRYCHVTPMPPDHGEFIIELTFKFEIVGTLLDIYLTRP